ncbi:MAG: hypothetical protein ACM3XM_19880 [Mycobacterium leprae]
MNLKRPARRSLTALLGGILLVVVGLAVNAQTAAAETIDKQLANPSDPDGNAACLACHSQAQEMVRDGNHISVQVDPNTYNNSVHGIISCVRCHAEVGEDHAKNPAKPLNLPTGRDLRVLKSEGCIKCHGGKYPESYNLSFHGVAVSSGDNRAATCVDCHGVHNILPSRNPASQVASANLAQTCGTTGCHQNVPANFANGTEHFVAAKPEAGGLNIIYKLFMGLICFDAMKDGPIVMFDLLRRLRRH